MWWKVAPIKVGLDGSVQVVGAEVQHEHSGVHEGQSQMPGCRQERSDVGEDSCPVKRVQLGARILSCWRHSHVGPGRRSLMAGRGSLLVVWVVC